MSVLLGLALSLVFPAAGAPAAEEIRAAEGLKVAQTALAPGYGEETLFALGPSGGPLALAVSPSGEITDALSGRILAKTASAGWTHAAAGGPALLFLTRPGSMDCASWTSTAAARCPTELPRGLSRILADDGELYAYGREAGEGDEIHRYAGGGKFDLLLKTPGKVTTLAAAQGRLIFASGPRIYQRAPGSPVRILFHSQLVWGIRSLTLDPASDIVIFSTDDAVYALRRGVADLLVQEAGGELALRDGTLHVLSAKRKALLTIAGLREILTGKK